jgi:hypothetical protein
MGVYFYAPKLERGNRELIQALGAKRLIRFDGMDFWFRGNRIVFTKGDVIICWGAQLPPISGLTIINSNTKHFTDQSFNDGSIGLNYFGVLPLMAIPPGTPIIDNKITMHGNTYVPSGRFPGYCTRFARHITSDLLLHVFNGKVIYAETKTATKRANRWYRSESTGFERTPVDLSTLSERLLEMVTYEVTNNLKLTFATVHLGAYGKHSDDYTAYWLPMVTAPKLSNELVTVYAEAFNTFLAKK